jgi:hypothetical protein
MCGGCGGSSRYPRHAYACARARVGDNGETLHILHTLHQTGETPATWRAIGTVAAKLVRAVEARR